MRVLLCLLSEQHVPNLLSVHHLHPEQLVLIESEQMKKRGVAENFLKALVLGGLDYANRHEKLSLNDVSDFVAIQQCLRHAYGKFADDQWKVNLTGGTKPMSIVAYEFFKAVGAQLIYIEASRPNEIVNVEGQKKDICQYPLSLEEFLAGYGFEQQKKKTKIDDAERRARDWWETSRTIAQLVVDQNLLSVKDARRRSKAFEKGLDLQPGELAAVQPEVRKTLQKAFDLNDKPDGLIGQVDKRVVRFLAGGWLEVFLWGLLDRHAKALGIWDVRLGIEPAPSNSQTGNDFDIAFMQNYSLCMIECKSGTQEHDPKTDALYKVEAITRQFRALRVRSWLATTSSNIFSTDDIIKQNLQDRAGIYNCRFVTKHQIRELAEKHESCDDVKRIIFGA